MLGFNDARFGGRFESHHEGRFENFGKLMDCNYTRRSIKFQDPKLLRNCVCAASKPGNGRVQGLGIRDILGIGCRVSEVGLAVEGLGTGVGV